MVAVQTEVVRAPDDYWRQGRRVMFMSAYGTFDSQWEIPWDLSPAKASFRF